MKKRLCIIQMHYTDITEYLNNYNAVDKIVNSDIFDKIIIAAADIKENQCLINWAKRWNIEIRFGSVTDVTNRLSIVINEFSAHTVLRILPGWYFIDIDLINNMIYRLEAKEADYILLPRDFDIRFGGDIFSDNFIHNLNERFDKNKKFSNLYKFNPWGYADLYSNDLELKIIEFKDVPAYSDSEFQKFKAQYNLVWPEHWDTEDSPQFPYKLASNYIVNKSSRVLDIACGFGAGSKTLLDNGAKEVIGVDISDDVIQHCKAKYNGVENLSFLKGDGLKIDFLDLPFDIIVTIHTMEHIIDDKLFLMNLQKWMKKNAIIILEVPLLMKYPFSDSEEPYGDSHIREYYTNDLIELFSSYFKVKDAYGVSRGFYTELEMARNAVLLVGENSL